MTGTEKLLRELIACPSVNPAFAPAGHPCAGEKRVAEFLAERAERAGLETEFHEVEPGRSNVYIRCVPKSGRVRHRVILAPHLDTVGGENLLKALFAPRLRADRLYGRGACDTKGSVAVMFSALLELARSGRHPDGTEVVFAGLVDEECNQAGSRALARRRWKADLAVVGEPTQLKVVTAHKGDLWLQLETRGKAAHGARPELGRNAVHEMARIVDALLTTYARRLAKRRHSLLGQATINVGSMAGGRQPNIVPDLCHISVDRRTLPGENDEAVKSELMSFLRQKGFRPRLSDTKGVPSRPLETDPTLPLVAGLMREVAQRKAAGVDYFSDAGVLAAAGLPAVLFGPGNIAQAHTAEEWINLKQLETARRVFVRYLEGLP